MNEEQILQKNKKIGQAILISQMQDHEGYKVFEEWLEFIRDKVERPNILELMTEKDVDRIKGEFLAIETIIGYLKKSKKLALTPLTDPKTGEEEDLKIKK